ncbi:MAG: hypothetical protein F4X65_02160 [Chloroflexi bacterium]|nr:hypothetical protein [Chloroflexota bacterium]
MVSNDDTDAERKRVPGEPMILAGSTIGGEPGSFSVDFRLWDDDRTTSVELTGLVDTRSIFTHVPEDVLDELDVKKWQDRDFRQPDGSIQSRPVGLARIELEGETPWHVEVIFEPKGSTIVVGSIALTGAALAADAGSKRLVPGILTL